MTCREFEARLGRVLEGTLPVEDHARAVRHAAACRSCAELVEPMGPALVPIAVEPPASFVTSVMARTSGSARASWAETWRRWMLRPRFAWEAAYVGVVLLTLACATPDSPYGRAQVAFRGLRSEAGILLERATSLLVKEKP